MRITKLGAAALAATLTLGGTALAFAEELAPADPTLEPDGSTTTTVAGDDTTTTTVAPEEEEPESEEGEETEGEAKTKLRRDNHGKIVSETARNTPPGPGHGKAVSEVARSTNRGQTKAAKVKEPKTAKDKAPAAE